MRILKANSGATVLFRPMKSGLVDMRYFIRCGAIDEIRPEDEGLCHALEHMLFAGTDKRKWLEINRDWEKIGAWYNAYTWHDRTYYLVTCLKKHWQEGYEVLADMMYNPIFPVDRWEEIEKGAVISEIQGYEDDAELALEEEIYGRGLGSKYHPICGTVKNIKRATMSDLKSFYDRYYCGSNVVFCIAGDLTETQVLRVVNKYDRLRPQKPPQRNGFSFNFNYKPIFKTKKQLEQTKVQLLKPVNIPRTRVGKVALDLASSCLSQYLFEELRERRGLCYGANADIYADIPQNYFLHIKTATDEERFSQTKKALKGAFQDFMEKGLTSERIRNVRVADVYSTICAMERVDKATDWLWEAWDEELREDPFKVHLHILENINDSTVRRAAANALAGQTKFGKLSEKQ